MMTGAGLGAARASMQGLWLAFQAPGLVLAVLLLAIISAVPFALVVERPVMDSLALQPPVSPLSAVEVDAVWWQEFRRQATGLAASFTPAVLGVAAPLDTVSALLDGARPPRALLLPIALSALVWAFLWGGVLHRFSTGATSLRLFVAAASRHFGQMMVVTAIAAAINLVLYLTLHAALFDIVYESLAAQASSRGGAFVVRVVLYVVFGAVLVLANAVCSFARVRLVSGGRGVAAALSSAWGFVRANLASVAGLYLIYLLIFGVAMVAYGAAELTGASRVGGWRAVAIGQAFVAFRLGLRLAFSAAQVRLAGSAGGQ